MSVKPTEYDFTRQIYDRTGTARSAVWEYFGYYMNEMGYLDRNYAICKLCRVGIKHQGSNTSNLAYHINRKHPELQFTLKQSPPTNSANSENSRYVQGMIMPPSQFSLFY